MVIQILTPGVEHADEADIGSEVLGVGRDHGERIGSGLEQKPIDLGLILVGDGADLSRQREHHVEMGDWQQLGLPGCQPTLCRGPLTLWTMAVATGIVGDARVRAVLAALDVPAQRGRAARLDCRHDAELA